MEYAAHPRFTVLRQYVREYQQVVFRVRLSPWQLLERTAATVPGAAALALAAASSSGGGESAGAGSLGFGLEWHVCAPPFASAFVSARELLVPTAILLRVTDREPATLPLNRWWTQTQTQTQTRTLTSTFVQVASHVVLSLLVDSNKKALFKVTANSLITAISS